MERTSGLSKWGRCRATDPPAYSVGSPQRTRRGPVSSVASRVSHREGREPLHHARAILGGQHHQAQPD